MPNGNVRALVCLGDDFPFGAKYLNYSSPV
nr:MAG TPA: hypothetical protein [Caudoviricetes sp.]